MADIDTAIEQAEKNLKEAEASPQPNQALIAQRLEELAAVLRTVNAANVAARALAKGKKPITRDNAADTKPCRYCAEQIKTAALICKHCNRKQSVAAGLQLECLVSQRAGLIGVCVIGVLVLLAAGIWFVNCGAALPYVGSSYTALDGSEILTIKDPQNAELIVGGTRLVGSISMEGSRLRFATEALGTKTARYIELSPDIAADESGSVMYKPDSREAKVAYQMYLLAVKIEGYAQDHGYPKDIKDLESDPDSHGIGYTNPFTGRETKAFTEGLKDKLDTSSTAILHGEPGQIWHVAVVHQFGEEPYTFAIYGLDEYCKPLLERKDQAFVLQPGSEETHLDRTREIVSRMKTMPKLDSKQ